MWCTSVGTNDDRSSDDTGVIIARAPGKLYIAGEYAVTDPAGRAIVVAVNRYVTASLHLVDDPAQAYIQGGDEAPLPWRHGFSGQHAADQGSGDQVSADEDAMVWQGPTDGFYAYAVAAMEVTERLRRQQKHAPQHYTISLSSELVDQQSGLKYGLGSSGAVVVAVVGAVSTAYGMHLSATEQYKLAALATFAIAPKTSAGDLAASVLGGWVSYASPHKKWLLQALNDAAQWQNVDVADLLQRDWPGLELTRLGNSEQLGLQLAVGWTETPADTTLLLDKGSFAQPDPLLLEALYGASDHNVGWLARALEERDYDAIGECIGVARELLDGIAQARGVQIETPKLGQLATVSTRHGWWGKSSGAGGGDCGIAIAPIETTTSEDTTTQRSHDSRDTLVRAWQSEGIVGLDIQVSDTGLSCSVGADQDFHPENQQAKEASDER